MSEAVTPKQITVIVPDIDSLSDEELLKVAFGRDGRWSHQTKALLAQFGVQKLDLNRGWASTWTRWSCPCCKRAKPEIARLRDRLRMG